MILQDKIQLNSDILIKIFNLLSDIILRAKGESFEELEKSLQ